MNIEKNEIFNMNISSGDPGNSEKLFRISFFVIAVFLLFFLPYLSFDFGITCDEVLHQTHGNFLLKYYYNESDVAIQSPFKPDGKFIPLNSHAPEWNTMNVYGGIFDFLCNLLYDLFPSIGEYETRHLLGSLVGWFAILMVGFMAKEFGGWRAGVLALVFLAASPRFLAHSMNNPKDLPFAAMYIFSLYQVILFTREYPVIKLKRIMLAALGISLALSIRVSGLLLIGYVLFFAFIHVVSVLSEKIVTKEDTLKLLKHFSVSVIISLAGYIGIWLFWPYTRHASFFYPVTVLKEMSNFDFFDSYNLFSGKWIHRWEIPWNYIPQWIWVTIPLFISSGLFLTPLLFLKRFNAGRKNSKYILMLVFTIVFPMLFVIINKSNVLDEYRHLLFVYLPMVVLCALSWDTLLSAVTSRWMNVFLVIILFAFVLEPLWWMKKNHPNECVYFSPLVGGLNGAFKKYETDYWGNSLREAAEWIAENKKPLHENDTVKVVEWYIGGVSVSYYLDKYKHVKLVNVPLQSGQWDYWIYLSSATKHNQPWLKNWPPPGTVHQVMADNTPLCAIIVNAQKRKDEYIRSCLDRVKESPVAENYFRLGFAYYKAKMYNESIEANKEALLVNPEYEDALNNMAAAYMELQQWDEVISACEKALEINPAYKLARNNLNYALSMKNPGNKPAVKKTDKSFAQLLNISAEYFNNGRYEECISACVEALEIEPASAVAYNNICISQYMLGNYAEAEKACKKALKIKPDFNLAANNMKMVKEKLTGAGN